MASQTEPGAVLAPTMRSVESSSPAPRPAFRLLALPLGLALLASLLGGCGESRPEPPRGVLLVSIDSLRADHLSCYGYESATRPDLPTTPILDRLVAARGARFTTAVSTTSWTLPSHMALLTGMPDELHDVRGIPDQLHPSRPWLPEAMRDAGWRTAGFWSGPNLDPFFGFDRGFELYKNCSTVVVEDTKVFDPTTEDEFLDTVDLHERSHEGITGPCLVESFDTWFGELGADERFFAFVHMWDVHYDYEAPAQYDRFYPGYRGPIDGRGFTDLELKNPNKSAQGRADLDRLISLYDAEIRFTDDNVGRMLDTLERAGRLDDTLVVLVSDHGEEFLEHSALGHKHSLFEETVRVPILMRLPGTLPAAKVIEREVVSLVDVAPTILELTNVAAPAGIWGTSLVDVIDGGTLPERTLPLELSFQPAPYFWRATFDGPLRSASALVISIGGVSGDGGGETRRGHSPSSTGSPLTEREASTY